MITAIKKLKEASIKTKAMIIIALLLTIAIFLAIPVLAWFNHKRQIAELQKVKAPDLLFISNACAEDVRTFDISSIKVSTETGAPTSQSFPFAVAGEYVTSFTLQFAHTTNNPFTYKIYYGDILLNSNGDVCTTEANARSSVTALNAENTEYNTSHPEETPKKTNYSFENDVVEYKVGTAWSAIADFDRDTLYGIEADDTVYILKVECIKDGTVLDYKNAKTDTDGRIIAKSNSDYTGNAHNYHYDTYGDYNMVNKYVEPLYWQKTGILSVPEFSTGSWGGNPFFRTFILDVSWNPEDISNKETDILYLSAYRDY